MTSAIGQRLQAVEDRILGACARVGRNRSSVELVAVSKFHPTSVIEEAYQAGLRDFGENYPQELARKAQALARESELRWHAIGRLQSNKAALVAARAAVFHAIDSLKLATTLGALRLKLTYAAPLACYIQVSFGETQKGGIAQESLAAVIDGVRATDGLELLGLMGIPPIDENAEASRPYFILLRKLARQHGLSGLSMGMTSDFEVAIEEGATSIRVGTALFGARPPKETQSVGF